MIIGLDLDDVVFATSAALKSVFSECIDNDIINHKEEIMLGKATNEKIKKFLKDQAIPTMEIAKPIDGAVDSIKKLRAKGNKIIFITARGNKNFPPNSEEITKERLKKFKIEYDDIIFNSFDKASDCKNNNIELFVDDSIKNCMEVKEKLGISVIGFESDINKKSLEKTSIKHIKTWEELLKEIEKYNK